MPRSAIFSDFEQIAREVSSRAISRRELLLRSSALVGALAVPPWLLAAGKPAPRVAIVGAGFAGLAAAYQLKKSGIQASVYEASSRVGGRVWSVRGAVGVEAPTEMGGEFIDADHAGIRALARELGLTVVDMHPPSQAKLSDRYVLKGQAFTSAEIGVRLKPLVTKASTDYALLEREGWSSEAARLLDRQSISEYLLEAESDDLLTRFVGVAFASEYGLDADDQSCLNLVETLGELRPGANIESGDDERYRILGGNQQVAERIAAKLAPGSLQLGHRVVRVSKPDSAYRLSFVTDAGNVEIDTDYVVLALPFTLLREVEITVPLPPAKRRAISELGMGKCAKIQFGMTDRPWVRQGLNGNLLTDLGPGVAWDAARGTKSPGGVYTVMLAGSRADRATNSTIVELALSLSRDIDRGLLGFAQAMNGKFDRVHWTAQKWAKGSYSCYKPGQRSAFGEAVASSVGRILFAGEHCSDEYQTYMEGAVQSGLAAARQIAKETVGLPLVRRKPTRRRRR